MITALMKLPADFAPTCWNTIVNGEVDEFLEESPG
jgi:hypothetical protein